MSKDCEVRNKISIYVLFLHRMKICYVYHWCRSNNNNEVQSQNCLNLPPCDANCQLSEWEPWSSCSVDCLDTRTYNFPTRSRERTEISSAIGNGLCLSLKERETTCPNLPNCPIDGEWSEWSKSVDCDKLCGEGVEIHTRLCEGPFYGGNNCTGESEKEVPCFLRDCFCDLTEWSDWSSCNANENGCGDGKKSRYRRKKDSEIDCSLREGDLLEEDKDCFTKHCTNEFFTLNKITIQVLEAEYPGTSKEWEITIEDSDGNDFCTTSAISDLDRGLKKSITGTDLGVCGTSQKKLSLKDFQSFESLKLRVNPKEKLNDMRVTNLDIYNCNKDYGGSSDSWQISIPGICRFGSQSDFWLGEWKTISSQQRLGQCFSESRNNWPNSFKLDFQSDGTDDMALCKIGIMTRGHFRSAYYYNEESCYDCIWTNDDYGKNAEYIGWGPLKKQSEDENKIKVKSVQLDFCVSDCDNGIAEFKSGYVSDKFHNMKDGFEVSLDLEDKRN